MADLSICFVSLPEGICVGKTIINHPPNHHRKRMIYNGTPIIKHIYFDGKKTMGFSFVVSFKLNEDAARSLTISPRPLSP